jgi:hypothetical protein
MNLRARRAEVGRRRAAIENATGAEAIHCDQLVIRLE